ncbi:GGDEF: diguanylate cyclase (GGDEF) domain [Solimicrobium silvestre]|uniref:Diguanylate cyclase DosC n=2 Tax=Solimicrobium silvestre TaxID=2099400 RepID=A0A2S9H053_9BURK|nr:GGDEF: diguanylate cyclase (GGDEF) domain [Solimicrobium silvestre]
MPNEAISSVDEEIDTFLKAVNTTEEIQLDRFTYLEFTRSDVNAMLDLSTKLAAYKNEINNAFSSYIYCVFKDAHATDSANEKNILDEQISNFHQLINGNYDKKYVRGRIAMGLAHRKLGLPFSAYIAVYSKYNALLRPLIWSICNSNVYDLIQYMDALTKVMYFDIGIALDSYCYGDTFALSQIQHEHGHHIEQLLASTEQLLFQKNHDGLTGLPNRHSFKKQLTHLLQFAENKASTISVIKLGLDHFKIINDGEGYETGDQVLKDIGARLYGYLHKDDLVAYWGSDTFTIVLSNVEQSSDVDRICNEINEIIRAPLPINGKKIHLTCSMGIALYPQDCQNIENLITYSNSAMNQAKELGGDRYQFFNTELDARLMERITIANELYNAIENNQFCLYYQPIADLQSGQIVSMEALIRWAHPVRGLILPSQFLAIAEELSIINKLGEWIFRQVCQDIRQWQAQGIDVQPIAINISPKQLLEPLFTQNLLRTLIEQGVDPRFIILEITEGLFLHNSDAMKIILKEFKKQGFLISMDDFGTGYSALGYLKHYPFDFVKIDQSFINNITENSGNAAITNAVISMAHSMGIKVIAEGVEHEAQCQFLSKNMCDQIQGYFLSRPMPREQTADYLSKKTVLPNHLLRITKVSRTLLLVDDEPNILAALKRLFRQDGYQILTANGGLEGLEILKEKKVDVIVSDQRMPVMTGVEFLRQAKASYPETVRIVLSGYTELQSITDAINEGAIYKFLTKPWDDQQLRDQIAEAFTQKEMSDENRRLGLEIQTANQELAAANRHLAEILQLKEKQIDRDETSLDIAREALQYIPIPMLGIDEDGMIAFANIATEQILFKNTSVLGSHIDEILPRFNSIVTKMEAGKKFSLGISDFNYLANWRAMGESSKSRGKLITFFQEN